MRMDNKVVACIVGPTASGKSALAVSLATRFQTEIVSADSVQVYREMDIGSAKPSQMERDCVPHHMIDCLPIDTPDFSVAKYSAMAFPVLDALIASGKLPIIVGGSGLYIAAITNPLHFAVPSDEMIRRELTAAYSSDPDSLRAELRRVDPDSFARLHPNDAKRIVRALEVYRCSGRSISSFGSDFHNDGGAKPPYRAIQIGLSMERQHLYDRINRRVDNMFACGLLDEARKIYHAGYDRRLPAMQSIGYRQLFDYFDGYCTLDEARENIKRETRRFAKRQMAWFRRDHRIHWLPADELSQAELTERATALILQEKEQNIL